MADSFAPRITAKSWAMIGLLGVVWGASFMFIELALRGVTPFWLAAFRLIFAGLVVTTIWRLRGGQLFATGSTPRPGLIFALGAISNAVPFMALGWGQQFVTAGFAGVSMAIMPLLVLPLAHLFVPGERMATRRVIGFSIGFCGVLILIGPEAFRSSGAAGEMAGRAACLFAASCYAVSSILTRRLPPIDPVGLSAVTLWIGAGIVGAAALATEGVPSVPTGEVLAVLLTLGLVQTAMADLLRISVIRSAGPTFMALVNYQVPVWSVAFGIIILNEAFDRMLLLALALILTGVAISQWGAFQRLLLGKQR